MLKRASPFLMLDFGFVDPGDFLAKSQTACLYLCPLVETNGNEYNFIHCRPFMGRSTVGFYWL